MQTSDGSETVVESEEKSGTYRINEDKETYELREETVRGLELEGAFFAEKERIDESLAFLHDEANRNNGFITLPVFIRYASMLINPRLKHLTFRKILNKRYDLNVGKLRPSRDDGDGDEHNDDEHNETSVDNININNNNMNMNVNNNNDQNQDGGNVNDHNDDDDDDEDSVEIVD